ncbi:MAG: hypothetical protein ABSG26_17535 [Bryobacteraceae bacterium]|jgi:hypothetical protein
MSAREIDEYGSIGDPMDHTSACAIQGLASKSIEKMKLIFFDSRTSSWKNGPPRSGSYAAMVHVCVTPSRP